MLQRIITGIIVLKNHSFPQNNWQMYITEHTPYNHNLIWYLQYIYMIILHIWSILLTHITWEHKCKCSFLCWFLHVVQHELETIHEHASLQPVLCLGVHNHQVLTHPEGVAVKSLHELLTVHLSQEPLQGGGGHVGHVGTRGIQNEGEHHSHHLLLAAGISTPAATEWKNNSAILVFHYGGWMKIN